MNKPSILELIPGIAPELPQAIDAEKATLGSVLLNREAMIPLADWLTCEMFSYQRHGLIYSVMLGLYQRRIPPDIRTVSDELKRRGELDAVGGMDYLSGLTDMAPSAYHVRHYAQPIRETYRDRKRIAAGGKIAAIGYRTDLTADEKDAEAHTLLTQATATTGAQHDIVSASDAVGESWDHYTSEAPAVINTGFPDLDWMLGGLVGGNFVIVAARPAVGKTSFALSLMRLFSIARQPSLLFSLEMNRLEVTQRLVSMESLVESRILRTRSVTNEQTFARIGEGHGIVGSWPWHISDYSGQTPLQIRTRTMRHLAAHPGSVILLDYIGLMASDRSRDNRTQEVSALSLALKNLARDANVPIIALAQLSRASEARSDHRPMLSDLRDSGSLEQDADSVLFLYRDELYDPQTDAKGAAELIVAKNRHGPTGVIPLRFDAATTRFDNMTYRSPEGYDDHDNR